MDLSGVSYDLRAILVDMNLEIDGGRNDGAKKTQGFLDHFGLESARDLPGLKELRAAGLLDNRPMPGLGQGDDEGEDQSGQSEMFED